MNPSTVRRLILVSALMLGTLTAHAATGVTQPATTENQSVSAGQALDFPAFVAEQPQTTCAGKPLPLFQESSDPTYALCVDNRLRRINPNDRVAYRVRVTDTLDGRPALSQHSLVSPVGRPIVDNVRYPDGYAAGQTTSGHSSASVVPAAENGGVLEFNTLGRTSDGKLVVRVRLLQETAAKAEKYTLADGETVIGEDGQALKVTHTAALTPGQAETFTAGSLKVELTVFPVPNP